MRILFYVSVVFVGLSLFSLCRSGFSLVSVYWSALSLLASIVFWRESSPARGADKQ